MNNNSLEEVSVENTDNYEYKGNPVKGLIYGLLIDNLVSLIPVTIIGVVIGALSYQSGAPKQDPEIFFSTNTNILIFFLVNGILFSIWAGYVTAKTINYSEYKYVVVLAATSILFGLALKLITPGTDEPVTHWNIYAAYILYIPSLLYGARMWIIKKEKHKNKGT